MKINFLLPPPDLSGGIRVVVAYAERLMRRGHDVLLIFPLHREPTLWEKARAWRRGKGWPSRRAVSYDYLKASGVPHRALEECRPVRDADVPDADAVVATWFEAVEWMLALHPSKGVKVHFAQGDDRETVRGDQRLVERVETVFKAPILKICVSDWVKERLLQMNPRANVKVVLNGVDAGLFYSSERDKQAVPTIGFVYSPTPCKGTDIILKAVDRARSVLPALRVVSFGSSPVRPEMPLPLGAAFHHQPPQEQIRHLYGQCDAWLVGSRAEGFGLPIIEAMACRTPVIATPAGAAPRLLAPGSKGAAGILAQSESPESMTAAVIQVARMSNENWKQMSAVAAEVAERHSLEEAADAFEHALATSVGTTQDSEMPTVASSLNE